MAKVFWSKGLYQVLFANKFSLEVVSVSGNVKNKRENFLFIDNKVVMYFVNTFYQEP